MGTWHFNVWHGLIFGWSAGVWTVTLIIWARRQR